jgi:hypothetical protein
VGLGPPPDESGADQSGKHNHVPMGIAKNDSAPRLPWANSYHRAVIAMAVAATTIATAGTPPTTSKTPVQIRAPPRDQYRLQEQHSPLHQDSAMDFPIGAAADDTLRWPFSRPGALVRNHTVREVRTETTLNFRKTLLPGGGSGVTFLYS